MKYKRLSWLGIIKAASQRLGPVVVALMLALALIMPALWASPAQASCSVYFRVEGPADEATFVETGEYQLIWAGNITVPDEVTITCKSLEQYRLYVNSSDRYIVERLSDHVTWDRGPADQTKGATSVLAALDEASQPANGNFTYEVLDTYFPGMGFFISAIDGHTGAGSIGWSYRVWNNDYAAISPISTDAFLLGYDTMPIATPHEQVLWNWGGTSGCHPLEVTSDKATVGVGEEFTATVKYFRDAGWSGTGTWETLAGATVEVGGETFITDAGGQAGIYLENAGGYDITARKGFDGSKFYIPTDDRTGVSVSGGDTSDWWVQTTQAHFGSGSPSQVDTSASPGDVKLARGGTVTDDYILNGGTATLGGEYFYDEFKIINGATLNVAEGEILRIHANYIEVDATSTINADGRGNAGGTGDAGNGNDGFGLGAGSGGVHSASYGGGGGGAGHNKDGGAGSYGEITDAEGGAGGYSYGAICRTGDDTFYLGSGGGGGAGNGTAAGGDGGDGGGAVVLEGMSLGTGNSVVIDGTVTAEGQVGSNGVAAGCGGGGGGSGGTILIKGKNISIANGALSVAASDGGDMGGGADGGGGGGGTGGHIKVFFEGCNDSSGHYTTRGYGGDGDPNDGSRGNIGSGSRKTYWYDYTAQDPPETYSPVLPYHASGTLESSGCDTAYTAADFGKLRWCATVPSGTEVKFQIATNNDNATWSFVGPDGTAGTYYTTSGTNIQSGHDGGRYIKYKAFFATTEPGNTTILSKVGITFVEQAGEVISFTVTDYGSDGILFGSLDPGQGDQPADWGGSQGAVTITVGSETNVDVTVQLKGTDFSGPGTISIGNIKYDNDDGVGGAATMTVDYVTWYTVPQPLSADDVTQVYHWISIPGGKTAGAYTSTFYYQAIKSL